MTKQQTESIRAAVLDALAAGDGPFTAYADLGACEIEIAGRISQEGHIEGQTRDYPGEWVTDLLDVSLSSVIALVPYDDADAFTLIEDEARDIALGAVDDYCLAQDYSCQYWRELSAC